MREGQEYRWSIDAEPDGTVHVRLRRPDSIAVLVDWRIPPGVVWAVLAALANQVPASPADVPRPGLRLVGPVNGAHIT